MPTPVRQILVLHPADLRAPHPKLKPVVPSPLDPPPHYDPSSLKTTSQIEFSEKSAEKAISAKPAPRPVANGQKFEGATTQHSDYIHTGGKPSTPFRPKREGGDAIAPTNDRSFSTESRNQYENKGIVKRENFKPEYKPLTTRPFDGTTVHQTEYKDYTGDVNARPAPSFKPVSEMSASSVENRDFLSENNIKYCAHPYSKAEPFIPAKRAQHNVPFEGISTNSTDYQRWGSQAKPSTPFKPVTSTSLTPAENRDFSTENSGQFNSKKAERVISARPARVPLVSTGSKFESTTTNKTDYAKPTAEYKPSTPFRPGQQGLDAINPTNDRMFETEASSQYKQKNAAKRENYKPVYKQNTPKAFDGTTIHQQEYKDFSGTKPAESFKPISEIHTGNVVENRDFLSETNLKYTAHPYSKATPFIPAKRTAHNQPFEGESTVRSDYRDFVFAPSPTTSLKEEETKMQSED